MSAKVKKSTTGATRLSDMAEGRQDVLLIDPTTIVIQEGFNYRNFKLKANKDHLKDTKTSIRINGVENPLWVRLDPETKLPVLIAGETRLRSVLEILNDPTEDDDIKEKVKVIPAIQKSGTPRDLLLMSLRENTQKPPSKWEVGVAYKRLLDDGMTIAEVAEAMGQTSKYVKEALELDTAPQEIKDMMSNLTVTPAHALWTIKAHGGKAKAVLESQIKQAQEKVKAKAEAKQAKKAAAKKAGKPDKGGRPAKAEKPLKLARPKAAGGKFIKDADLKLIQSALKVAAKSEDVDVSMTAQPALDALNAALKGKE